MVELALDNIRFVNSYNDGKYSSVWCLMRQILEVAQGDRMMKLKIANSHMRMEKEHFICYINEIVKIAKNLIMLDLSWSKL